MSLNYEQISSGKSLVIAECQGRTNISKPRFQWVSKAVRPAYFLSNSDSLSGNCMYIKAGFCKTTHVGSDTSVHTYIADSLGRLSYWFWPKLTTPLLRLSNYTSLQKLQGQVGLLHRKQHRTEKVAPFSTSFVFVVTHKVFTLKHPC